MGSPPSTPVTAIAPAAAPASPPAAPAFPTAPAVPAAAGPAAAIPAGSSAAGQTRSGQLGGKWPWKTLVIFPWSLSAGDSQRRIVLGFHACRSSSRRPEDTVYSKLRLGQV